MKESFIKSLQKFINDKFFYHELLLFIDNKMDFLLQPMILEKIEKDEYNAMWDTLLDLKKVFPFDKSPNFIIGGIVSVNNLFQHNLSQRMTFEGYKNIINNPL